MIVYPYVTDIGFDEVSKTFTWIGSPSDPNWSTGSNWDVGGVPTGADANVYIPNVSPNFQPVIIGPETEQVDDIIFESGGTLVNNGWL
jgi:hypothetical protein